MSLWWQAYLTPSSSAVKFAIKATLAMLLALYIALWCDLERPYWALISAAFLQIRPMSGMVFEKGLSQLLGTAVGCLVGIAIMAAFVQAPTLALGSLTLWIMLCTYAASVTRNNASYGCVMGAVTAMLIVIITASAPDGLFSVAVARLSELSLGAICATLVSSLLWPTQVRDHLTGLADEVARNAFQHAALRLNNTTDVSALQQTLTDSLTPLTQLETDSQAARYEGPEGQGRIRASHVLTRRTLRLMAILYALQQLLRYHGDRLPEHIRTLTANIADGMQQCADASSLHEARERLHDLRHQSLACLDEQSCEQEDSVNPDVALRFRLLIGLREALGHALVIIDAREAMHTPSQRHLKAPSLAWHRDHLTAVLNALRSGLIFALLASFWVLTSWDNGQTAMLLGTLFSAMFATRENPAMVAAMFGRGMLFAIPSAFLFGHILLSQAHGFGMLVLAFFPPLFLGLLGAGNPRLAGYCLGFTIGNILLTMPGNAMDFDFDGFANRAIAVMIGLSVVVMAFRMIPGLPTRLRKYRLVAATVQDLREQENYPLHEVETRFSGKMADRLLQLAHHDHLVPEDRRYLFTLGLTGLDLGHASMHLRRRLQDVGGNDVAEARRQLSQALADDYAASARGQCPERVAACGAELVEALRNDADVTAHQRLLVSGLVERLWLSLQRQAERSRTARSDAANIIQPDNATTG
ncbi:FUSC family protein [Halomonas huangheensis]|uniref:Fusaric acid resistance protein n=1 Tax=Halomonas huangheensis TaxID=1178482 RepID=W1N8T9_9GAMM|nr:FUSC family protein [Halomonas huangheensis]ALM53431.1 fusaric acid resistance protein [Halomonas huangheensis]ERL51899.1 hypothetical protein BJB45_12085 [Halomonas huangheensis]